MKHDAPDEIGSILERALWNYSHPEPRPGLDDRVLHHVFAARARSRFVFPAWAFAAVAAALVLIAVPRLRQDSVKTPAGNVDGTVRAPAKHESIEAGATRPAISLPKQAKFPAAAPITEQERALWTLARSAPDEALKISQVPAQPVIAPIRLEAVRIAPLHIDAIGQGVIE